MKKETITLVAVIAMSAMIFAPSFAQGCGCCGHYGYSGGRQAPMGSSSGWGACEMNRNMRMFWCNDWNDRCEHPFLFRNWKMSLWSESPWADLEFDNYGRLSNLLTEDKAVAIAEYCIKWSDNPKLKVGKVAKTTNDFEIEIVNGNNATAYHLAIDLRSAVVRPLVKR